MTKTRVTRWLPAVAALALAADISTAAAMTEQEQALYEAAKQEGELTWYIGHLSGEVAEAVGAAFTEAYPGVKVNVVRTTGQVAYQRLMQELQADALQADVIGLADQAQYVQLRDAGYLAQFTPANAGEVLEVFQGIDPEGTFHVTSAALVGIAYNTDAATGADVPQNWTDLLDPKWQGRAALGHPAHSSFMAGWAVLMRDLYGEEYFDKLEANDPHLGRSINDAPGLLNSGEAAIAVGSFSPTLASAAKGNPIAVAYPADGTILFVNSSAVMKDAQHPQAARLFMQFLISPTVVGIEVQNFYPPIRADVPPLEGSRPLGEVKLIAPTLEDMEQVPELVELFRDKFGI
jgi:iron(III) transport system substrate-binding protein